MCHMRRKIHVCAVGTRSRPCALSVCRTYPHTHTHTTRNGFFCSYCLRSGLVHTYANRHTYTNLPSRNKAPQHTTEKHENANNEFKQETCRREMSKKQNEKKKESHTHTHPHTHTPTHTHTHTTCRRKHRGRRGGGRSGAPRDNA